jgi:hypothetical protein
MRSMPVLPWPKLQEISRSCSDGVIMPVARTDSPRGRESGEGEAQTKQQGCRTHLCR